MADERGVMADAGAEYNIGIDIEDIGRFASVAEDPALRSLFSLEEFEHCSRFADSAAHFAGTWCAKEAAVKALWPWVRLEPRLVTVHRTTDGRPSLRIASIDEQTTGTATRVSISQTSTIACASVIAWGPPGGLDHTGDRP